MTSLHMESYIHFSHVDIPTHSDFMLPHAFLLFLSHVLHLFSTSPGSPVPMSNFLSPLSGRPLLFSLPCLFMCNFMTVILLCISNLNIVCITLLTRDSWLIYRVNKSQHLRTPTSHLHFYVLLQYIIKWKVSSIVKGIHPLLSSLGPWSTEHPMGFIAF